MAQVLVVCTGNICRSPMAEGFLRELFRTRSAAARPFATEPGGPPPDPGDEPIRVSSAGTSGWDGSPPTPEAIDAAAERDADIRGHRARRLMAHHVEQADLVLGMTTDHRDAAIQLVPTAAARTFSLKELVRLLEATQPAASPEGPGDTPESAGSTDGPRVTAEALRRRVAEADALRIEGYDTNRFDLDVVDPIGLSIDTYRAVAWELDELCVRLMDALFGTKAPMPSGLASLWNEGE